MDAVTKSKEAQRITIYGAIIDIILGIIKVVIGVFAHSHALVVDGIHSFSDLFTDIFVILIAKYAHEEPDEEHPYGHGRFETLGTVAMGTILIGVSGIIAYENIVKLFVATSFVVPAWPAIIAALLSVILKEWAYWFQLKVGKKINSPLIIANAWHSRSDALSSLAVLIGLIFAMVGMPWLDVVMAVVVAIMIGKIGWDLLWSAVKDLVDTSLEPKLMEQIKDKILSVYGVKSMHNLRSRRVGDKAILDVNIEVSHHITASEAHEIATYVSVEVVKAFDEVVDITVHADVEDDSEEGVMFTSVDRDLLPLRDEVEKELFSRIETPDILHVDLHYNGPKMVVDLMFDKEHLDKVFNEEFKEYINKQCSDIVWLEKVQVLVRY
jgi:cation diffusion facilitator family transporter